MTARLIASGSQWTVRLSDEGRTAHPYAAEVWGEDHQNHPSIDLVQRPEAICLLPEIKEFPPLAHILIAANVSNHNLRTTACSPGIMDCSPARNRGFTRAAGALVHIALRDENKNKQRQNLIDLARRLTETIEWSEVPDSLVVLTVEPYKSWRSMTGFYGLAFEFHARAYDDEGAWKKARAYARPFAAAISQI